MKYVFFVFVLGLMALTSCRERDTLVIDQSVRDEQILQEYFRTNNLRPVRTASGLYYQVLRASPTGQQATNDSVMVVHYQGRTLYGDIFDSSYYRNTPFQFRLGRGEVISGWDEGVKLMRQGEQFRLFIPSGLAYGPRTASPLIGPNSILVFDIELNDIKP